MMSSLRRSLGVIAGATALILAAGSYGLQAQEPGRSKVVTPKTAKKVAAPVVEDEDEAPAPKTATKKKSDPRRRLYPYFGQLGLSETQKNAIYDIRAKHAPKIDALEKQLEDIRAQAMAEAEKVLKPEQRKLLEERRKAAHAAAEARSEGETKPAPAASAADTTTKPADAPVAKKRRRSRAE